MSLKGTFKFRACGFPLTGALILETLLQCLKRSLRVWEGANKVGFRV